MERSIPAASELSTTSENTVYQNPLQKNKACFFRQEQDLTFKRLELVLLGGGLIKPDHLPDLKCLPVM